MKEIATQEQQQPPQHGLAALISAHEVPSTWDDWFGSVCPDCNLPLSAGQCPGCGCAT